jgi:hypothetical protein
MFRNWRELAYISDYQFLKDVGTNRSVIFRQYKKIKVKVDMSKSSSRAAMIKLDKR